MADYQRIAEQIDTGADDPKTTRALIVFNPTAQTQSGVARFHAEMAWPLAIPLPPVILTDGAREIPLALVRHPSGPDRKGRPDHEWLSLDLRFPIESLPPRSWKTYWARYADRTGPALPDGEPPNAALVVVETPPHPGILPPAGTFAALS